MIKKYYDYIKENEEFDINSIIDDWEVNEDEEDDDLIDLLKPVINKKLKGTKVYRGTFIFELNYNRWRGETITKRKFNNFSVLYDSKYVKKVYPIIEELIIQGINIKGSVVMKSKGTRLSSKYTTLLKDFKDKKIEVKDCIIRSKDVIGVNKEEVKNGLNILYKKKLEKYKYLIEQDPKRNTILTTIEENNKETKRLINSNKSYEYYILNNKNRINKLKTHVIKLKKDLNKIKTKEFDMSKEISNL